MNSSALLHTCTRTNTVHRQMAEPFLHTLQDAVQVQILTADDAMAAVLVSHLAKLKAVQVCRIYNNLQSLFAVHTTTVAVLFIDAVLYTAAVAAEIQAVLPGALIVVAGDSRQTKDACIQEHIFNYITVPFVFGDIFLVMSQVLLYRRELVTDQGARATGKKSFVLIKSEYRLIKINLTDILFIAGMKDYIKIWIRDKSVPYTTLQNLKEFETKLPPQDFIRVHKSYIVALQHIDCIARNEIMIGTYSIPVGDAFRNGLNGFIEAHT